MKHQILYNLVIFYFIIFYFNVVLPLSTIQTKILYDHLGSEFITSSINLFHRVIIQLCKLETREICIVNPKMTFNEDYEIRN